MDPYIGHKRGSDRKLKMQRRTGAITALLTSAALALSACGGGAASDNKIEGTEDANASTPSPPKTAEDESAKRPEIKLPSDLTYKFEWGDTGADVKNAVLHDTEQFIKAVDMAIAEQDPMHPAYIFYSEGDAAAGSTEWIQEYVDYKDRITGVRRFYNAKVNVKDENSASVAYCEDQSKAYNKSIKTGKVDDRPTTNDSYVSYSSRLRRNDQGVWVTYTLDANRGAAPCLP